MKKILIYFKIRRFYNTFGDIVGDNFITKLSDMTAENVHDVLFDINEVLDGYYAFELDEEEWRTWLKSLRNQIINFCDTSSQEYAVALLILLSVTALVVGCIISVETHKEVDVKPQVEAEPKVHTRYTAYGRYYTDGTVITDDGNEWSYSTDAISDQTPYNNMPVWIGFDDNGTPTDITDDIILGLVYDRETAVYDALETTLTDKFELEREGNNIKI